MHARGSSHIARSLSILLAFVPVAGCDEAAPPAPAASAAPIASSGAVPAASASAPVVEAGQGQGQKHDITSKKGREVVVYLDGKPVAVLRHAELPPSLKPTMVPRGRSPFPLWSMARYVEAVGADLNKIKEIHMIGGNRPSVMKGPELLRLKEKLHFAFTRITSGKPYMDWPEEPYTVSTTVDRFYTLMIYQEKEPPTFVRKQREFQWPDGTAVGPNEVPYADPRHSVNGTRFYADGRLQAAIQGRDLPEAAKVEGKERLYRLPAYLESVGIKPDTIKALDFVQGDAPVGRLEGPKLREALANLTFKVPRGKGEMGRITMEIPIQTEGGALQEVQLTAVQAYLADPISPRDFEAPAKDHQPGKGGGKGGGRGEGKGKEK